MAQDASQYWRFDFSRPITQNCHLDLHQSRVIGVFQPVSIQLKTRNEKPVNLISQPRQITQAHNFVRRNIEKPLKVYIFVDNINSQSKLTVFRATTQTDSAERRLKLQVGALGCRVLVPLQSMKTGLVRWPVC